MFEVVKTGLLPSTAPVNGTVKSGTTIYSVQVPRDQTTGFPVRERIPSGRNRSSRYHSPLDGIHNCRVRLLWLYS